MRIGAKVYYEYGCFFLALKQSLESFYYVLSLCYLIPLYVLHFCLLWHGPKPLKTSAIRLSYALINELLNCKVILFVCRNVKL